MSRVFVTGVGAISPLGKNWAATWESLLQGKSGVRTIQDFDPTNFETKIAAEVPWDEPQLGDLSDGDESGQAIRLALGAAAEAVAHAKIEKSLLQGPEVGIFLGCGTGVDSCCMSQVASINAQASQDPNDPQGKLFEILSESFDKRRNIWSSPEAPASALAQLYGVRGPVRTHLTACAASAQAVGEAFHALRSGKISRALAGGAHAMVHPDGIMAFSRLGALSTRNEDPETASRPFDSTREGFVMGEGGAVLILETEDAAQARGATLLAEVVGYGVTADGYRATDPDPSAIQVSEAITRAMSSAGLTPEDVDYVSAHGTSTQANDSIESKALLMALGERARAIPVSSVKSMLGHLIAAAGAMEALVTTQCLIDGRVPPTRNLTEPDEMCPLDYVSEGARDVSVRAALSNSFGFGGQNVCLAFRKV